MVKIAGAAVVAVWLVMLSLLAHKGLSPDTAPARYLKTGEQWMGIYLGGKKVGHAVERIDESADGYALTEDMVMGLTVQGFQSDVRTVTHSRVGRDLALKGFDFNMKSGAADITIKGEVAGRLMKLDVETAGRVQKVDMPLTETPHLASDLELYIRREGLEAGKKFRLPFFDPTSMSQQYMDITVEGREDLKLGDRLVPVYRVREDFSGMTTTAWINPDLGTVKGDGPMGFTFLMETREQALSRPEGGSDSVDIIAFVSVPAKGDVPEPRTAAFLKARVTGADMTGIELSGGRQTFSGGVLTVTEEDLARLPKTAFPVTDPAVGEYLKPTPLVQSDDPALKKKAREIIGSETDALTAARKLSDWVNKAVEKKPSAGIPSAVEVLRDLEGDCNEHTTLYTALARSVGLPAKMDAGIVMVDGRFYYHAWPEVYVGRWVSIDPTFGQFPADATHIRLVEGGLDKQIAIAKLVGKLQVEILEHH